MFSHTDAYRLAVSCLILNFCGSKALATRQLVNYRGNFQEEGCPGEIDRGQTYGK